MKFPLSDNLRTQRLRLRPLKLDDAPAMLAIYAGSGVTDYLLHPPFADLSAAQAWAARAIKRCVDETAVCYAIERRNGQVIGNCSLFNIHIDSARAEIGYTLGREWWGAGYMSEAVTALLDFAICRAGLRRIEADIDPDNHGSAALLERLGFLLEGRLRQRWRVGDRVTDSALYGLLAQDWTARD